MVTGLLVGVGVLAVVFVISWAIWEGSSDTYRTAASWIAVSCLAVLVLVLAGGLYVAVVGLEQVERRGFWANWQTGQWLYADLAICLVLVGPLMWVCYRADPSSDRKGDRKQVVGTTLFSWAAAGVILVLGVFQIVTINI